MLIHIKENGNGNKPIASIGIPNISVDDIIISSENIEYKLTPYNRAMYSFIDLSDQSFLLSEIIKSHRIFYNKNGNIKIIDHRDKIIFQVQYTMLLSILESNFISIRSLNNFTLTRPEMIHICNEIKLFNTFPLRKGSSGPEVRTVQEYLVRVYGSDVVLIKFGIDGNFGDETEKDLKRLIRSGTVTKAAYDSIVAHLTVLQNSDNEKY